MFREGNALKCLPLPLGNDKGIRPAGAPMAAILMPDAPRNGIPAGAMAHLHKYPFTFDSDNPAISEREGQDSGPTFTHATAPRMGITLTPAAGIVAQ